MQSSVASPLRRHIRELSVRELLVWTYRDQRAHRYLRDKMDWLLWALDQAGLADLPKDRRPVHQDAALVHEAVLALGERAARLLVYYGAMDCEPERCTVTPRPLPVEPVSRGAQKIGWHYGADGHRVDHVILVAEIVEMEEVQWRQAGRRRVVRDGTRTTRYPVEYCPIDWHPSPAYIAMTHQVADEWEAAISALQNALAGVPFRDHALRR